MRNARSKSGAVVAAYVLAHALCAGEAHAVPTAPSSLCRERPDIPACQGAVPTCSMCHTSTDPAAWNAYGMDLKTALGSDEFAAGFGRALTATDVDDSDGDGVSNGQELMLGRSPAVAEEASADEVASGVPNPRYDVGRYDARFALKRVSVLYCGHSPSYEEVSAFAALASDPAAQRRALHEKLDACLGSDYWRKEGLARLADKKIRPLSAAGPESKVMIAGLRLVIGDFNYDYRLFRHSMTDHRDMRALLTATYHVQEDASGALTKVEGEIARPDPKAIAGGQPLPAERRAGMLTTQWYLAFNTMFSAVPRTSAAQAYRAYLGADIAASEGLRPVAGEPLDVDNKGVSEARCALCHSTLDPLSYAFAEYEGINVTPDLRFGDYMPERTSRIPNWQPAKQQSVLLDQPVKDLVQWAKVASESDEFKRAMTDMFFHHAFNRGPVPEEQGEFAALWQALPGDGYSANRLLHRLIDVSTFGRP
jgi:hypothetical protein